MSSLYYIFFDFSSTILIPRIAIWNLLIYVDLETSSKMKLICVSTHYYWSIPFSTVAPFFFNFSHVCQIYVAEVLIYIFVGTAI